MTLILSILAGLLGSLFGSAARAGAAMGRAQLEGEPMPAVMNLSGSPIAGVVGGVVGLVAGPRTAFWLGAVMGAAGIDRFDAFAAEAGGHRHGRDGGQGKRSGPVGGRRRCRGGGAVGRRGDGSANQAAAEAGERCGVRRRGGRGRRWPGARPRCGSTSSAVTNAPSPALSTGPAGAVPARTMSRPSRRCWRTRRATPAVVKRAGLKERCRGRTPPLRSCSGCQGGGGTDFGVPSEAAKQDAEPLKGTEASARQRALLEASWKTFDAAARSAKGKTLRLGPRGGGRNLAKMSGHVTEAEVAYLGALGSKPPKAAAEDEMAAIRKAALVTLDAVANDLPIENPRNTQRPWSPRYFIRRSAWHALDHAWEIEDRIED